LIRKTTPYIYILFFLAVFKTSQAQKIKLLVTSKDSIERAFLSKLSFKKLHRNTSEVSKEIDTISYHLKKKGYFTNTVKKIIKKDSLHIAYFSLGKRIEKIVILFPDYFITKNQFFQLQKKALTTDIDKVPDVLKRISKRLEKEGYSFSEVSLNDFQLKNNILYTKLNISLLEKRKIDTVIVKGYQRFPRSFIKHSLNINKKTIFNQQELKKVSKNIRSLNFVSEIKPPEVLFSKDSTLLYLYLKQEKRSRFDGLINFSSKENGKGILFTGHIDLKLTNIFHKGESFTLLWNRLENERQRFKVSTFIPYIYSTAFSSEFAFSIYKQDSTFINTQFNGKLLYHIDSRKNISFDYISETSSDLTGNNNTIESYNNYFLGSTFSYTIPSDDFFKNTLFYFSFSASLGKRINNIKNSTQSKFYLTSSYLQNLNSKSSFYLKNISGYLNAKKYLFNELFRIGGLNSIRGFNEQSINTSKFSIFNFEYRFKTSITSYLYSITDVGFYKDFSSKNKTINALGVGYTLFKKSNLIQLSYVLKNPTEKSFTLNNTKIYIRFLSFF